MITITGGCYKEVCVYPKWNMLYGSALRAAVSLASLTDSISICTCVGNDRYDDFRQICETHNIRYTDTIASETTIQFHYFHPLGSPEIIHSKAPHKCHYERIVTSEFVLKYGAIELDATTHSKKCVYDPQSPTPIPFSKNGSTAEQLALVLNEQESRAFSTYGTVTDIAKDILSREKCSVVIIKRGALGALVATPEEHKNISCYITNHVFPIGSGDIFSATFAHFWCEKNISPFLSAQYASIATARYCQDISLPTPQNITDYTFTPATPTIPKKIYLAGPFFDISQRWLIEEIRRIFIAHGVQVFSPLHDVGVSKKDIFTSDINGLMGADIVFAICNGLDAGTLFEIGYATSVNKPVIALAQNISDDNLTMLRNSNCIIERDLSTAFYKTLWR
jgi:hypothetical protein